MIIYNTEEQNKLQQFYANEAETIIAIIALTLVGLQLFIEPFSTGCCKTKAKVTVLANHKNTDKTVNYM